MKKYFEQLRPMERRLAVGVIVALLLVGNYVFIWPDFGEWGQYDAKIQQARQTLKLYQDTIAKTGTFQQKLKTFENQGEFVAPEDQAINFMRAIQQQSQATQVAIVNASRSTTHTNDVFFVEQVQNITVSATDAQLVDFLYRLGNDPSMIRVRDLEMQPDGPRQRLNASIQLVASYQRSPGKNLKNATAFAQ
jgi:type II secretory pathway component PulM